MKSSFRVMLGRKSMHAAECFAGGFIPSISIYRYQISFKLEKV